MEHADSSMVQFYDEIVLFDVQIDSHLLEYSSKGSLLTTRIIKLEPKLALVGMILDKK